MIGNAALLPKPIAWEGKVRDGNQHLARYLAFVAGAANAGGFLAVRQYTSHMSGIVAAMTDNLASGNLSLVLNDLAAVGSTFIILIHRFLSHLHNHMLGPWLYEYLQSLECISERCPAATAAPGFLVEVLS